ncbi:MAG: transglutaminase-like domain-containing protein [Oscillospiraceae bacterium]|jgi:transglutaminase-like putative cysteine protease|nr:transglutaminase-like domain-containing protein [Oscillospiraceae bacterium]
MLLKSQFYDINRYLESDEIIDYMGQSARGITDLSSEIMARSKGITEFVKNAYEYVRDNISHSADIQGSVVTCRASDVLQAQEGICFAKAHLLAAILRCNYVPTGFCYQKLILDDINAPYLILHGLNAVYIEEIGRWIRLDARGNKPGVNAQFSLEQEKLAFPVRREKGEVDIPIVFANPDQNVIKALTTNKTLNMLWSNLPVELDTAV